jgi:hypothetical protein
MPQWGYREGMKLVPAVFKRGTMHLKILDSGSIGCVVIEESA